MNYLMLNFVATHYKQRKKRKERAKIKAKKDHIFLKIRILLETYILRLLEFVRKWLRMSIRATNNVLC